MNLTQEFLKFALATGPQWVMYLLILCSIVNIAIIIDRILFFQKMKGDFSDFIRNLTDRLNSSESLEKTSAWCSGQKMLEASVAAVGLERGMDNIKAAEESMHATMIAAKMRLEKGTVVLGTLGSNTPFIGLFGTIIGIIEAFHALSTAANPGPEVIMASISEALVATALGLLVAIPAVISYNFFNRAIKKKMANSDATARIILTHIGTKR
ncbi:MotA/TolQ/ExbB proton channel family protein [Fluviispira vulneris]|uniref:MotA/TolQ/ExbB proton channel family protein n=1 Tax=Fluviispira vulneris TaxID=2763012 RepID=UPI00164726EB|nr:MotA/TolQ/ExbB proton channel family protein [Fluviispira vulneris]